MSTQETRIVDLRSDTITRPTPAMRQAMMQAPVGDDVYGEDPTANRLQAEVAELLGKEAALFVPSGMMGNQLALKVHTQPGDEVILERQCHIFNYESGAPGILSGVQLHTVDGIRGIMSPEQVAAAIRPGHYWEARSRLVCLENTVNKAGGVIYPMDEITGIAEVCRANDLRLHLDGARLWNASASTGIPERDYAAPFDTVNVCISKGLGAPVGSLLAGPAGLIEEARRFRKLFGGGMRQIGMLAEACRYALQHHRGDLARDHDHARRFAEGIAELPGIEVAPPTVETNIVMFEVPEQPAAEVVATLGEQGVQLAAFGPHTLRVTTHRDVDGEDIDYALQVMRAFAHAS